MATRRTARPNHVRPRPPSGGRPSPVKVRPRAPAPGRVSVHAPVRRSRGIPLIGRLAARCRRPGRRAPRAVRRRRRARRRRQRARHDRLRVRAGRDGDTRPVAADGDRRPTPRPSQSPSEPYTNQGQVDLTVTVPTRLAGDPDYLVRVYLALKDQAPAPIDEKPLAPTPEMIIPVALTKGVNDFTVTLVGPERRVRAVAARPLRARQRCAGDPARVAQGRGHGQPQGRHAPGTHPGPLDAQRPQQQDRRLDRRDGRRRRHVRAEPAAGRRLEPHHGDRHRPGRQQHDPGADRAPRARASCARRSARRTTRSASGTCRTRSGWSPSSTTRTAGRSGRARHVHAERPGRQDRSPATR